LPGARGELGQRADRESETRLEDAAGSDLTPNEGDRIFYRCSVPAADNRAYGHSCRLGETLS
jgi:hypothetical protein